MRNRLLVFIFALTLFLLAGCSVPLTDESAESTVQSLIEDSSDIDSLPESTDGESLLPELSEIPTDYSFNQMLRVNLVTENAKLSDCLFAVANTGELILLCKNTAEIRVCVANSDEKIINIAKPFDYNSIKLCASSDEIFLCDFTNGFVYLVNEDKEIALPQIGTTIECGVNSDDDFYIISAEGGNTAWNYMLKDNTFVNKSEIYMLSVKDKDGYTEYSYSTISFRLSNELVLTPIRLPNENGTVFFSTDNQIIKADAYGRISDYAHCNKDITYSNLFFTYSSDAYFACIEENELILNKIIFGKIPSGLVFSD